MLFKAERGTWSTYYAKSRRMNAVICVKSTTPTLTSKWYSFAQEVRLLRNERVIAPTVSSGMFQNRTILATEAGRGIRRVN